MDKHEYHIVMDIDEKQTVINALKDRIAQYRANVSKGLLPENYPPMLTLERIKDSIKSQHYDPRCNKCFGPTEEISCVVNPTGRLISSTRKCKDCEHIQVTNA